LGEGGLRYEEKTLPAEPSPCITLPPTFITDDFIANNLKKKSTAEFIVKQI
jgi:hypothetical protein